MDTAAEPTVLVGIDWATQAHEVLVLDRARKILGRRTVPNTTAGHEALIRWLLELAGGVPERIAVAIERPDGLLVEALLDHLIAVYAINPKQLDRFRDRYSAAGAKDDRRDALVLADALRTDSHAFHRVVVQTSDVVALRGFVREDDALRIEENVLDNRLRELLGRYYPQMLALAADRPAPFLWDLWELAPNPQSGATADREAIAALLRRHRIRRLDAAAVVRALAEPAPRLCTATATTAEQTVRRLLPRLKLVHAQRAECGRRIDGLLKALEAAPAGSGPHPDATILRSLPGVGRAVLARVLADGAEALRDRDLNRLRALGGSAPVTRRSGQSCQVVMRRACSARLRFAYYHWGRTAVQQDARAKAHYQQLRARGRSHGRALRGVVDRLLAVAVAMLRSGTLYDPKLRALGSGAGGGAREEQSASVGG
jgi:transposase